MELPYRKNVGAILFDGEKILLVTKPKLGFWQFVQGGVEKGETEEETLSREVLEETGVNKFRIIKRLDSHHQWDWVPELQKAKGFKGQKQNFFLVKVEKGQKIKLQKEELEDFKWIFPNELEKYTKYSKETLDEIINELKKL